MTVIKLTFALVRLPHLSREAFQTYWLETHGPLVRSVAETLKIRRYVQCHTLADPAHEALRASRGGPEAFDGVAELWWDRLEDALPASPGPEQAAAGRMLLEDERRFIDLARSPLWWSEERVIVGSA